MKYDNYIDLYSKLYLNFHEFNIREIFSAVLREISIKHYNKFEQLIAEFEKIKDLSKGADTAKRKLTAWNYFKFVNNLFPEYFPTDALEEYEIQMIADEIYYVVNQYRFSPSVANIYHLNNAHARKQ